MGSLRHLGQSPHACEPSSDAGYRCAQAAVVANIKQHSSVQEVFACRMLTNSRGKKTFKDLPPSSCDKRSFQLVTTMTMSTGGGTSALPLILTFGTKMRTAYSSSVASNPAPGGNEEERETCVSEPAVGLRV